MPATGTTFPMFIDSLAQKKIDIDSDTHKVLLLSAYTFAASHQYVSDVKGAGTEASGTGYTAGGAAITGVSWARAAGTRANSTAYALGAVATPGNGHWYVATTGGTSGGSTPTWPTTDGGTVTDGSVVWTETGRGNYVWQLKGTFPTWNAAGGSLAAKYAVVYDSTPGTDATNPVEGLINLDGSAGTVTATDANFTITQNVAGVLYFATL